jgi:hypothetical protein
MGRLSRDLADLRRAASELFAPVPDDETARFDLALSARTFSRRTKRMIDDKLTFTASLMRAGEVQAAHEVLAEVERDVLDEEAALFEQINEVRAAQAVRRQHMTRLRLARTMAVALIGSVFMGASAVAMTVARTIEERDRPDEAQIALPVGGGQATEAYMTDLRNERSRRVSGSMQRMLRKLTPSQLLAYRQIVSGALDPSELPALLAQLPDEVQQVLAVSVQAGTDEVADDVLATERLVRKKLKKQQAKEDPEPNPSPSPSPDEEDGGGGGGGSGDGDGEGDGQQGPLNPDELPY